MPSRVTLKLLGRFDLRGPAGGYSGLQRPLPAELAYLLALAPEEPTPTRDLAEMLWPGMAERWSQQRLWDLTRDLRERLGVSIVEARGKTISLNSEVQCDLWDLLRDPSPQHLAGELVEPTYPSGRDRYERAVQPVTRQRAELLKALRGV